jgi:preprotein translocase SecE subunit
VDEVLPALQQARGAQGIEVAVATGALTEPRKGMAGRLADFLREVRGEIQKVTWPGMEELRKATIVIVIFVAILGVVIGLMDSLLQLVFVTGVARLFQ